MVLLRIEHDRRSEMIDWILSCQDPKNPGGFGPNKGHDADITATHYALLVLCILDATDQLDAKATAAFIAGLQKPDGSFSADRWGEADMRFAYCAVSALTILDELDLMDID